MSHDTEEWSKIWRKTALLFKKWQKFGEFQSENSKVSKICILIGAFCAKYITFDLKTYRGVIFHNNEVPWITWRKTYLWFGEWHEEFGKFSPEHLKMSKLGLWWDAFVQSRKYMSYKITEDWCVMTLKIDEKFKEELTCRFKINIRNVTNFDLSTWKSKKSALYGLFLTKVHNVWVQRSYPSRNWRVIQIWKKNWLFSSILTWGI